MTDFYQAEPKTWTSMNAKVKDTRRLMSQFGAKVPFHFNLWNPKSHNGHQNGFQSPEHLQLIFLSIEEPCSECTLFSTLIPNEEFHGSLPWTKLIDSNSGGFPTESGRSLAHASKEEVLMNERKRTSSRGITSYQMCMNSGRILFPADGSLFQTSILNSGFKEVPSNKFRNNATVSPCNPDLIAFYNAGNIWIYDGHRNDEWKLTNLTEEEIGSGITAGWPSYITLEEFDRYQGFWWSPVPDPDGYYSILYEETDERSVDLVSIAALDSIEQHRFPRPGTQNSKSALKIVTFKPGGLTFLLEWNFDFHEHFPWCEYIPKMGWTPNGKSVWAFLLDRCQKRLEVVIIDRSAFTSPGESRAGDAKTFPLVQVIFREDSDSWINVSNIFHVIEQRNSAALEFIVSSEETGFRHLYHVKSALHLQGGPEEEHERLSRLRLQPQIVEKTPLTSGEWTVSHNPIEFDSGRNLVFFHGYRDCPLEKHGYVVALDRPCHVRRLTESNYSHSCDFFVTQDVMVTVFSNTQSEPSCQITKLKFTADNNVDNIQFQRLGWLLMQRECDMKIMNFPLPNIFHHQISSGHVLYSIMYQPPALDPQKKYPVVLNIYGGPDYQLVTNTFKGGKCVRNYLLSSLGYVVISIDSRGSSNRGKAFESHIYKRLGTVELKDQLEVLEKLAKDFSFLDLTRVAINGWSYGGYLALRGIVDHPDVFKLAIAGAPVTDWLLYDTGYTERYMDLPENNPTGYALGSVLKVAFRFPDDRNRLLVAHGKLDENVHFQHTERLLAELTRHNKDFTLKVYPTERHSLRTMDVSEHFETTLICFLADHL